MDILLVAIDNAFSTDVILYTALGVFLGVTIGAIPGLSGDIGIALLLPFVYKIAPACSLGMMIGIYKGSMFGGSITAISFGIPGTAAAAATVEDGYKAKLNGHPQQALLTALYSSVTGDTFSDMVLIFLAVPMARIALNFGPVEFFALYIFALMLITLLTRGKAVKGLASGVIGLIIGACGMDPMLGTPRLNFGVKQLRGGVSLIPLLVGIFAISELITQFSKDWHNIVTKKAEEINQQGTFSKYNANEDKMSMKIFFSTLKATMIGALTGTSIGALPGAGSSLAAYVSYGLARRFSKHPEKFGHGSLEGVAAPEAGNNATCGATFIPLFAFGIPGSGIAAIFGAALIMLGITPGPTMLSENTLIIFTLFVTLIYANFINLGISRILLPLYARVSMLKTRYLVPAVFTIALLGTYASRNSVIDIWVLLIAGILGAALRKNGFPLGPLVLGYIIGPGMERALRQALIIGGEDRFFLFKSSIAIGLYVATIIFLVLVNIIFRKKTDKNL